MSEPAQKARKVVVEGEVDREEHPAPQRETENDAAEREGSPDIAADGETGACAFTGSPSPTRASPSPNLTPRPPQLVVAPLDPATRSRPPSLPRKDEPSPVRVPYSIAADSRSHAPDPLRASLEPPLVTEEA
eukprot:TRINITY_DN5715_c0_g1_i1.p4 TRINITY_DN5715_c0_g1~~TRINITY_DN5715_c0_g1_i1.p4  ORF type:complete len:132 (+),score=45.70 TRINITY_DN5715_c0_g1_i1:235-630(+)